MKDTDTGILVGPAARFGWLISLKWRAEQERMANTITVTASPEAWAALLSRLPRCVGCRKPAVLRLHESSTTFVVCSSCAQQRPAARAETLAHADIVALVLREMHE